MFFSKPYNRVAGWILTVHPAKLFSKADWLTNKLRPCYYHPLPPFPQGKRKPEQCHLQSIRGKSCCPAPAVPSLWLCWKCMRCPSTLSHREEDSSLLRNNPGPEWATGAGWKDKIPTAEWLLEKMWTLLTGYSIRGLVRKGESLPAGSSPASLVFRHFRVYCDIRKICLERHLISSSMSPCCSGIW